VRAVRPTVPHAVGLDAVLGGLPGEGL